MKLDANSGSAVVPLKFIVTLGGQLGHSTVELGTISKFQTAMLMVDVTVGLINGENCFSSDFQATPLLALVSIDRGTRP